MGLLLRETRGAVAVLTLNRPEKLNALNPALFEALAAELAAIEADEAVQVVLLKAEGRAFSAGADMEVLKAGHVTEDPEFRSKTVERLADLGKVVIAAVQGYCVTGGLELALAADVIVASGDATFRDTHARVGIVPRWGLSARLPRRVGPAVAARMSLTGEPVGAEEALRIGLCDYVVAREDLEGFAMGLAERVAGNDPRSIAKIKALYRVASDLPLAQALVYERGFTATPRASGV